MTDVPRFSLEVREIVRWGDMDAMGHLNNTVYFRFFESLRVKYLDVIGLASRVGETSGYAPILASTRCDFKLPLTYPDEVIVRARISRIGRSSFTQEYEVYSITQGAVAATGDGTIVCLDAKTGKSAEIPAQIRKAIEEMEGARGS